MNGAWWFMSPIIVYYIIFPILEKILDYCGELLLAISAFVLFFPLFYRIPGQISIWLLPFTVGMYCARVGFFEKLDSRINTYPKKSIFIGCTIILAAIIRSVNSDLDTLFALAIILSSYFLISRVPIVNTVLEHLGRHSGVIFMFHTFIYNYYFHDYIYWFKYSPLIFIAMVVACDLISVGLEWLKMLTRYDRLINVLVR